MAQPARYIYTDRDGGGVQDRAIRAYGCAYLGQVCERAGAWYRGKAIVRFLESGDVVVARARLLRRLRSAH